MKKHLLLSLFALPLALAADVRLAWDPADGATNYVIYASTTPIEGSVTNAVRASVGTNTVGTVKNLTVGRWWFAVIAFNDAGMESELSNVVTVTIPPKPTNLRIVPLTKTIVITNGYAIGTIGFDHIVNP